MILAQIRFVKERKGEREKIHTKKNPLPHNGKRRRSRDGLFVYNFINTFYNVTFKISFVNQLTPYPLHTHTHTPSLSLSFSLHTHTHTHTQTSPFLLHRIAIRMTEEKEIIRLAFGTCPLAVKPWKTLHDTGRTHAGGVQTNDA